MNKAMQFGFCAALLTTAVAFAGGRSNAYAEDLTEGGSVTIVLQEQNQEQNQEQFQEQRRERVDGSIEVERGTVTYVGGSSTDISVEVNSSGAGGTVTYVGGSSTDISVHVEQPEEPKCITSDEKPSAEVVDAIREGVAKSGEFTKEQAKEQGIAQAHRKERIESYKAAMAELCRLSELSNTGKRFEARMRNGNDGFVIFDTNIAYQTTPETLERVIVLFNPSYKNDSGDLLSVRFGSGYTTGQKNIMTVLASMATKMGMIDPEVVKADAAAKMETKEAGSAAPDVPAVQSAPTMPSGAWGSVKRYFKRLTQ